MTTRKNKTTERKRQRFADAIRHSAAGGSNVHVCAPVVIPRGGHTEARRSKLVDISISMCVQPPPVGLNTQTGSLKMTPIRDMSYRKGEVGSVKKTQQGQKTVWRRARTYYRTEKAVGMKSKGRHGRDGRLRFNNSVSEEWQRQGEPGIQKS